MTRKERAFKKSLGEEKARVRLYKSGKNWVKAGIKEIQLLKMLAMSLVTDKADKEQNDKASVGSVIKNNALKTTAITGGLFTVNMLHDQQALAASETPVTSELATNSQTVGDQTSVVIEQSQSTTDSEQSATASESETTSESDVSQSSSDSASETVTSEEQASLSESESKSLSESEKASLSESQSQSETADKSSTVEASETLAQSQEDKSASTASDTTETTYSMTTAEASASESTTTSTAVNTETQNISGAFFRSVNYSMERAASTVPTEQVFTGTGYDTLYKLPIYYHLKVTSDGSNITFQYTVGYDDPNTATIEKPNVPTQLNVATSWDSLHNMLSLGDGYGTPTTAKNGYTTGYNGEYLSKPAAQNFAVNKMSTGDGYWWDTQAMGGYQVTQGRAQTTTITVPIVDSSGDTTWTFRPFAHQDGALLKVDNYFNEIVTGTADPAQSESLSISQSQQSESTSKSASESLSNSESESKSTSLSNSESKSLSESESKSTSLSNSESKSIS
ncbi:KxYKxGKxW signal peptide domain-containing protein, partial [Staphylococcus rostri]